jgi:hypothetical protein
MNKNLSSLLLLAGVAAMTYALFSKSDPASETDLVSETPDTTMVLPADPSTFPALLVHRIEGDSTSVPLHMSGLKLDVKVVGNIALSTMEMTFYNDLDRVLEGDLCFPLGEGQTVSGFGMETDGVMRDGVVVEKAKARQVFESVVRRRIDPGLLEWTKGNNFKTRVYPIPAHGSKRVRISFEQELISTVSGFVYLQPMLFKDKIEKFDLRAEVIQQSVKPRSSKNAVSIEFDEWNNSWVAEKRLENFTGDKALSFEIPKAEDMQRIFVENTGYFYLTLDPVKYIRPKKLPSSVCLLWDVSGSGLNRDIQKEEALLDVYFKKLQNAGIHLVTFSNTIHTESDFILSKGNWQALKEELDRQVFDGGTQLGAIDLKKYKAEEILLCSDGLSTFGDADMKLSKIPVNAICSSQSADHSMLKYITQATGGHYINALSTTNEEAMKLIGTESYRFLGASPGVGRVSQLYPSIPTDFNRTIAVAGKIESSSAEVTLNFGFGDEIVYSKKVLVHAATQIKDGFVKKLWAQKKISELDMRYEKNKKEIIALGKECSIVTRNTSLLVLDRLEDYIQHHVVPPQKEWQEQYYTAINEQVENVAADKNAHLEEVVQAFQQRIDWWNTSFKYRNYKKEQKPKVAPTVRFSNPVVTDDATETETAASDTFRAFRGNGFATADSVSFTPGRVNETSNNLVNAETQHSPVTGWSYNDPQNGGFDHVPYEEQETTAGTAYTWSFNGTSDGTVANQSGAYATTLNTTSYNVTVTDANGATMATRSANFRMEAGVVSKINLKAWDPKTPYMEKLKKAKEQNRYATYLDLRKTYKDQPAFFLDAGNYFIEKGDKTNGLRVLSNLAEFNTEDHKALRVLAHKLQQAGFTDLAIAMFKEVLKIREEEPQSYRDLGLALADKKEYQGAVDMLCKVANKRWDSRFPGIEVLAANEINSLIASSGAKVKLDSLDKRLIKPMPVDVRIVINWESDNCDMDLWVTDPVGEQCMYSHNETLNGGRISQDFTGGYGPEEFIVKKALNGKYLVQVNYYGTREQTLLGPTTVQAELYTNYGKPNQKKQEITLRLKENKEVVDIGALAFGK